MTPKVCLIILILSGLLLAVSLSQANSRTAIDR